MNEPAATPPAYFATGWTGGRNPWLITAVVTMATFMEMLDTSIANVSLPHMAGNLGVGRNESTWILTSYLIANAVMVPMSGWMAGRFGRKRFYLTSVVIFTAASLLCAAAPTLEWLVVCRVLQGLGGGGLAPCEQAILVDTFPPARRGSAMAVYGMTVVAAPAIGPTLGGAITDHLSWRWVFLINVPIGIVSLLLAAQVVSDPPHLAEARRRSRRADWPGLLLIAIGLAALEVVLDKGQEAGWLDSRLITVAMLIAGTALVVFVVREWHEEHPVLELRLLARPTFAAAALLAAALGFTSYGATVLLPQYLQALMGYSAQQSGMVLSPGGLTILVLLPLVGRLVARVDPRALIAFGFAVVGGSLWLTACTINLEIGVATVVQLRVLSCVGFAFLFVPIQTIAYGAIPPDKSNQASSLMNLMRNLGADVGIAFLVTQIYRRRQMHQVHLVAHATAYDAAWRHELSRLAQKLGHAPALRVLYERIIDQALALAYRDALFGLALAAMAALPLLLFIRRPATARRS